MKLRFELSVDLNSSIAMAAPSPGQSASVSEPLLKLLRQARSRFAAIVYSGRLHSLHVADNPITNLFNIALPRVKALKELEMGPVYTPLQILVLINNGSQTILFEKWDIVLEQLLYGPSVTAPILNRRLLALMRVVMAYMRSLPSERLYYDYKGKFQAEGRDLFELRLIQQPTGTNLFDQVKTKTMNFSAVSSEAGNLRISVTFALNPEPSLSALPLPGSTTSSGGDRNSSGNSTSPLNIVRTIIKPGEVSIGSPSPTEFIQDDYRGGTTSVQHRRPSAPVLNSPYKPYASLDSYNNNRSPHQRNQSESPRPSSTQNMAIPTNPSRFARRPGEPDKMTGRSAPVDIPTPLRNSQSVARQSLSKSPPDARMSKSPTPSSIPQPSDIGMMAVIRHRRESTAAQSPVAVTHQRTTSGNTPSKIVGSPSSSIIHDEFSMGTPKYSSFDGTARKDGSKNPSPPKPANPNAFRASPGPNASPLRSFSGGASFGQPSPPLGSLPEDNMGKSPSTGTTGMVGLLQSPETYTLRSMGRSLSAGSTTSTSGGSASLDVANSTKIDELSEEDSDGGAFAMDPHHPISILVPNPYAVRGLDDDDEDTRDALNAITASSISSDFPRESSDE